MNKYRFVKFHNGHKYYAHSRGVCGLDRKHAILFTEIDFIQWGEAEGYEREELGEDVAMKADAPMLPATEGREA